MRGFAPGSRTLCKARDWNALQEVVDMRSLITTINTIRMSTIRSLRKKARPVMVAASFSWSEILPSLFAPAGDPSRLSEILPTLMQRYGLETQTSESRNDSPTTASSNGARPTQSELSRERTTAVSSPNVERRAASVRTRCRDSQ